MAQSSIEWTDVTDNIIVAKDGGHWCRKFDDACKNCYAERLNQNSFFGGNKLHYIGAPPTLVLREEILRSWKRQTKLKKHFVASMTDVCGEWVPPDWVFSYLDAMADAPNQTFQILTKRASTMFYLFSAWLSQRNLKTSPPNIWAGVSLGNQKAADKAQPFMRNLALQGWLVWVSYEPALSSIDWEAFNFIKWMVSGGESGPGARPSHPNWHRAARDFCTKYNIPYFFKQWGAWKPVCEMNEAEMDSTLYPRAKSETDDSIRREKYPSTVILPDGSTGKHYPLGAMLTINVGKKRAGRTLDNQVWNEFPKAS